jgi:hypothetical protein
MLKCDLCIAESGCAAKTQLPPAPADTTKSASLYSIDTGTAVANGAEGTPRPCSDLGMRSRPKNTCNSMQFFTSCIDISQPSPMRWCERTTATSSRGDEKIGVRDCVCAMERVKQLHERDVGLFWILIQRALESGCAAWSNCDGTHCC